MSELINNRDSRATIRWKLLTSASALALTAAVSSVNVAKAEDADRPLIWLELGGQMENVSGQGDVFAPAFLAKNSASPVISASVTPLQAQRPSRFGFGEEGKISFQPEGSDWVFSAAARIGRSSNVRHVEHQTDHNFYKYYYPNRKEQLDTKIDFADTHAHRQENHAILDFTAGKDVGLGIFGKDASSTLSAGVRIAQFTSSASVDMRARPDRQIKYYPSAHAPTHFLAPYFHTYHATGQAARSFRGLGPSISWTGSTPFAGNAQDGDIAIDWGINAALLFGKQKARVQHQESAHYYGLGYGFEGIGTAGLGYVSFYHHPPRGHITNRSVTVPNVGGSLGISFRKGDAKVSFGYRADFFFGAMDTGIDVAKKSNLTFNGPYASIAIGLGD